MATPNSSMPVTQLGESASPRRNRRVKRKDAINLVSLTCSQIANAGLPLIIFPYLLHISTDEQYANIVVAEVASVIAGIVVLYGFDVDGVSQVAGLSPNDSQKRISSIFSEIFVARVLLFAACASIAAISSIWLGHELMIVLFGWMLVPLSYVFQPTWLFVGLERNAPIAAITICSRIIALLSVLTIVKGHSTYFWAPALVGGAYLIGAIATFAYAKFAFRITIEKVGCRRIVRSLIDGKEVFFGGASVILYRDMNVLLLKGVGGSGADIAAYSIAEKLTKGLQAAMRPLNQLYFPKAVIAVRDTPYADRVALGRIARYIIPQLAILGVIVAISIGAVVFAGSHIIKTSSNPDLPKIMWLFSIMAVAILFGVTNFMLGTAGLNTLNERKFYFKAIFISGVCSVALCLTLARSLSYTGAAISFVFAEVLLTALVIGKYLVPRAAWQSDAVSGNR